MWCAGTRRAVAVEARPRAFQGAVEAWPRVFHAVLVLEAWPRVFPAVLVLEARPRAFQGEVEARTAQRRIRLDSQQGGCRAVPLHRRYRPWLQRTLLLSRKDRF